MKTVVCIAILAGVSSFSACKNTSQAAQKSTPETKTEVEKPLPEATFYPGGEIKTAGKYKDGKRQGTWSSWYENGELRSEAIYEKGERNGQYKVWYENGQPKIEGAFTHEKPSGTWLLYDSLGVKVNEVEYKDGKPVKVPAQ